MKYRKDKIFKEIRDSIFYMQGFAGWAVEDYQYADEGSKIKQRWDRKAASLIAVVGGKERTLQILDMIKR